MRSRCFDVLALLSLLGCAAAVVVCVRSASGGDRLDFELLGVRYSARTARGRVELWAPPQGASSIEARAWELAASLRNDDIAWIHTGPPAPTGGVGFGSCCGNMDTPRVCPAPRTGSSAAALDCMRSVDVTRPLLSALNDPKRAVAAHALLGRDFSVPFVDSSNVYAARVLSYDGMHLVLKSPAPGPPAVRRDGYVETTYVGPGSWVGDATDLPAVRESWYARLSRPVAGLSLVPVIVLLSAAPAAWLWLSLLGITWCRRARSNLCHTCGYDVRATPDRCPECGTQGTSAPPAV